MRLFAIKVFAMMVAMLLQDAIPDTDPEKITENTLTGREVALRRYMIRRDRFAEKMLVYGQSGILPDGRSVRRVHPGHHTTRDWRLLKMPKRLKREWHADWWSLIRKSVDSTRAELSRSCRENCIPAKEFLDQTDPSMDTQYQEHQRIERAVDAWLRNKPPKIPATEPEPGFPL